MLKTLGEISLPGIMHKSCPFYNPRTRLSSVICVSQR